MNGEPIRTEGAADPGAVDDLADRMAAIPDRRGPLLILCLASWIVLGGVAALLVPCARRPAFAWLALAFAYMPLMLLAGAAIAPSGPAEGMLVGVGAGALGRSPSGWSGAGERSGSPARSRYSRMRST